MKVSYLSNLLLLVFISLFLFTSCKIRKQSDNSKSETNTQIEASFETQAELESDETNDIQDISFHSEHPILFIIILISICIAIIIIIYLIKPLIFQISLGLKILDFIHLFKK